MRYVTIPAPVVMLDPLTDEPLLVDAQGQARPCPSGETPTSRSFAWGVRMALVINSGSGEKAADIQTLRDVRMKIDRAAVGDVVELSDDEWKLIEPIMRKPGPQAFGGAWVFCAESHQRAWLDAPSKRPGAALLMPAADGKGAAAS